MGLLTNAAIEGYKNYTKKTLSYCKYRVGGTYYHAKITNISVMANGRIAADVLIDHTVNGDITVTEIQLYDQNNQLWLTKPENIQRKNAQEGILYRFTFNITEGTE